jgi:hypothetical protein
MIDIYPIHIEARRVGSHIRRVKFYGDTPVCIYHSADDVDLSQVTPNDYETMTPEQKEALARPGVEG